MHMSTNMIATMKDTMPRAIMLMQTMFKAAFVEVDTSNETEEPIFHRDVCLIMYFTVFYFVCAWTLRVVVLRPIARFSLTFSGDKRKLERRTDKSEQSLLEALEYGLFSYLGYTLIVQHSWVWPSTQWFGTKAHEGPGSQISLRFQRKSLSCFYMFYVARYTANLFSVIVLENHRKDFVQMVVHHICTMVLVLGSYFGGYGRIGSLIMLCMDPADVPLHIAKVIKYMAVDSKENVVNPTLQVVCDLMFAIFVLVFTFTRLIVFGYLVYSGTFESAARWGDQPVTPMGFYLGAKEHFDTNVWICLFTLYILYGLQVFWKSLIARVLLKILAGGNANDIRESDVDSDKND